MLSRTCISALITMLLFSLTFAEGVSSEQRPENAAETLQRLHVGLTKESLLTALQSKNAEIRELAAQKLAEDMAVDAIPAISEALRSETVALNKPNLALFLALLGSEQGPQYLKQYCRDSGMAANVRLLAAQNLLAVKDGSCFDSVVHILSEYPDSRSQALMLLPQFGKSSTVESRMVSDLVAKSLTDPSPAVRIIASAELSNSGDLSALPQLRAAIAREANKQVKSQMEAALAKLERK